MIFLTTPKEALFKLWNNYYFRPPSYRSIKEIEEKVSIDYGCTYSNWNVLLSRTTFLRKTKKGWIQKIEPQSDEKIKIIFW